MCGSRSIATRLSCFCVFVRRCAIGYVVCKNDNITIEKGSITVNGVSLTVVNSKKSEFSVAIIPYTFENTNFNSFSVGTLVNLEFDVFGKYVTKLFNKK